MRDDTSHGDSQVALAVGPVAGAGAGAGPGDTAVALPRLAGFGWRRALPRPRVLRHPFVARLSLALMLGGAFAVVAFATAGPSVLVPRSYLSFPHWESGPLHHLFGALVNDPQALNLGFSGVIVVMLLAYGGVLASVRTLSMRTIVISIVALHLILLMSPPLQLTDLFNYLGYARLGALHHLNPYTNVIAHELHDPVYRFTSWHNLRSPYGPLFTAISYLVAFTSVPVAYWILKVLAVLASLAFIALVWQCARQLGRDPRYAVLFVAANPIYLMYAVGGFHNDFFMLIPSTAAIALMLSGRDRSAGAALMIAVAVKFTAILMLPFLLIAAPPALRRWRILAGAALAAVPLVALSLALFGFSIPNLSDQSTLLTDFSIPNLVGLALGVGGGTPELLRLANVALVLFVAHQVYRRRDWLSGAGWSTFALIASLAWLVPWYVVWLLPLAALGTSVRLRRAAVALTVFLIFAFVPATSIYLANHGINLLGSSTGQASASREHKLSQ